MCRGWLGMERKNRQRHSMLEMSGTTPGEMTQLPLWQERSEGDRGSGKPLPDDDDGAEYQDPPSKQVEPALFEPADEPRQ